MNIDEPIAQTEIPGKGLFARYPLTFYFIIAYVGTWLVWSLFVLSQNGAGLLPFRSPMSYMITIFVGQIFGPALAAFVMTGVTEGKAGLRRFMGRIVQWRVGIKWYLFVLIGIPAIMTLGTIVPSEIRQSYKPFENPVFELLSYLVFYVYPALLIGGPLFEELGWRGFAQPRLQVRFGPMAASLILGLLWAFWHMPIWFSGQVGSAQHSQYRFLRLLYNLRDVYYHVGLQQHERQRVCGDPGACFDGRLPECDSLAAVPCYGQDDRLSPLVRVHGTRTWLWSDGGVDYHLYARPPGLPALPSRKPRLVAES